MHFRSAGLPYLSATYDTLAASWIEHCSVLSRQLKAQYKHITQPVERLQEATQSEFGDRLVSAAIETFRKNPVLRDLVNSDAPLDIPTLRHAVRDYSGVDFSPFHSVLEGLPAIFQRSKQKKALNQLTMNLDALFQAPDQDLMKRLMVWECAARFTGLLKARGIAEHQWRNLVVGLWNAGLVTPSSLIYLWCRNCPEIAFSMSTTFTSCELPPWCPSCGRIAHAIGTYTPSGCFRDAMLAPDGMLWVAIAWHLRRKKIRFDVTQHTGGTEFDFLMHAPSGTILLECKMLHILSANLVANLGSARKQLRDHLEVATKHGIKLIKAACIVNFPKRQLRSLLQSLPRNQSLRPAGVPEEIISYEEFPVWVDSNI